MNVFLKALKRHKERMEKIKVSIQRQDLRYLSVSRLVEDLEQNDDFDSHFQKLNDIEKHVILICLEQECYFGLFELKPEITRYFQEFYGKELIKRSLNICKMEFNLRFIYQSMKKNRLEYESKEEKWRQME